MCNPTYFWYWTVRFLQNQTMFYPFGEISRKSPLLLLGESVYAFVSLLRSDICLIQLSTETMYIYICINVTVCQCVSLSLSMYTWGWLCVRVCYIYIYIYIYICTGCPGGNVPDFGRLFLKLKYTYLTKNPYIRSWTVTEIKAREVWNYDSCYTLIDYQIHIKTGRNMWFL